MYCVMDAFYTKPQTMRRFAHKAKTRFIKSSSTSNAIISGTHSLT
jgi:hypothetical protein